MLTGSGCCGAVAASRFFSVAAAPEFAGRERWAIETLVPLDAITSSAPKAQAIERRVTN